MGVLLALLALIALVVFVTRQSKLNRRRALLEKYGDAHVVDAICRKRVWEGMTKEQLIDSRGRPADIDEKVLKTKVVLTYKYDQDGRARFRTRVTVENGLVVGWTQR